MPPLVVLTGGIASGKSAASAEFERLGVPVIDTDIIARQVVEPDQPGLAAVIEAFGNDLLDAQGQLDRRRLRDKAFVNEHTRKRLEAILHPMIEQQARREIAEYPDAPYVVLVVPLLVETGLFTEADHVIVVDVPESLQFDRLLQRDGIGEKKARAMLAAQAGRDQRLAVATEVIDNTGSRKDLEQAVHRLHERLVD